MQLHNLKRAIPNKKSRQVGRGGDRGKTSGRGGKGQTARAGAKVRPEIRDMIKRLPKLRGRGKNSNLPIHKAAYAVNVMALEKDFATDTTITVALLKEKQIVPGSASSVKILGTGELTKKFTIQKIPTSKSAAEKIEKAGGSIVK